MDRGRSSPVSFGFTGAYYSSFTLGAQNFFLDQVRGVPLSLGCFEEFNMKGSMCSYRPYIGHWCGRLLKAVLYLTPIKFELFRETEWHSGSKLELPSCKLALEFCKKTKRFSIGKQLKTGCPGPQKISKMGGTEKGLKESCLH